MTSDRQKKTDKRPYERPKLHVIELTAEEIMGKCYYQTSGTGPAGACKGCSQATSS